MTSEWLKELLQCLNPTNEPGRIVLIHRMGADNVGSKLPALIDMVQAGGFRVLYCVDPMHGNTETTAGGIKTRRFQRILSEVEQSFQIHQEAGSHLGGIHFELTGENVTECLGGAGGLDETDLERAYRSKVDPRLNYEQALEMALCVARSLKSLR
jgi:3-deoxy-7-phosphoheptulonate synthase